MTFIYVLASKMAVRDAARRFGSYGCSIEVRSSPMVYSFHFWHNNSRGAERFKRWCFRNGVPAERSVEALVNPT